MTGPSRVRGPAVMRQRVGLRRHARCGMGRTQRYSSIWMGKCPEGVDLVLGSQERRGYSAYKQVMQNDVKCQDIHNNQSESC